MTHICFSIYTMEIVRTWSRILRIGATLFTNEGLRACCIVSDFTVHRLLAIVNRYLYRYSNLSKTVKTTVNKYTTTTGSQSPFFFDAVSSCIPQLHTSCFQQSTPDSKCHNVTWLTENLGPNNTHSIQSTTQQPTTIPRTHTSTHSQPFATKIKHNLYHHYNKWYNNYTGSPGSHSRILPMSTDIRHSEWVHSNHFHPNTTVASSTSSTTTQAMFQIRNFYREQVQLQDSTIITMC